MSNITISRATALQALAAMDKTLRFMHDEDYVKLNHAIDTFEAALAQEEQAVRDALTTGTGVLLGGERIDPASVYKQQEQEQEPVAWSSRLEWRPRQSEQVIKVTRKKQEQYGFTVPLYTHPPRRKWQGLTEEEMDEFLRRFARYELIRAVEAALKERNT
jgi:hypothetical protein